MKKDFTKEVDSSINSDSMKKRKTDLNDLGAKIVLSFLSLLVVFFISLCIFFAVTGYKEGTSDSSSSSDSWNESYSKCVRCGVKKQRKYLYGNLCGKCYKETHIEID